MLEEKYHFPERDAAMIASFLEPMLATNPQRRATAAAALRHPWLNAGPVADAEDVEREEGEVEASEGAS